MWIPLIVAIATCAAIALRSTRWAAISLRVSRIAYGILFPLSLIYFPARAGFHLRPVECEWTFDFALAIYSLRNFAHIGLFAIFFLLTCAQLPGRKSAIPLAFAACFVMGFAVEIAEGATGIHHCRMRDLIPDMAGACIGALLILAGRWIIRSLRAPA